MNILSLAAAEPLNAVATHSRPTYWSLGPHTLLILAAVAAVAASVIYLVLRHAYKESIARATSKAVGAPLIYMILFVGLTAWSGAPYDIDQAERDLTNAYDLRPGSIEEQGLSRRPLDDGEVRVGRVTLVGNDGRVWLPSEWLFVGGPDNTVWLATLDQDGYPVELRHEEG